MRSADPTALKAASAMCCSFRPSAATRIAAFAAWNQRLDAMMGREAMERVRIDKWLCAARFFKTRGVATAAVVGGRVRVNGARAKPSKEVCVGDTVEVTIGAVRRTVRVAGISDRRGPASVAAALYSETAESVAARERYALERRLARPLGADLGSRPTKLDRRRLDALRRKQGKGGREPG